MLLCECRMALRLSQPARYQTFWIYFPFQLLQQSVSASKRSTREQVIDRFAKAMQESPKLLASQLLQWLASERFWEKCRLTFRPTRINLVWFDGQTDAPKSASSQLHHPKPPIRFYYPVLSSIASLLIAIRDFPNCWAVWIMPILRE